MSENKQQGTGIQKGGVTGFAVDFLMGGVSAAVSKTAAVSPLISCNRDAFGDQQQATQ